MVKIQMKTYSELITYRTFKERLDYLRVTSPIGIDSFGYDRYLNQFFYHSPEWICVRDKVIVRDHGCDLGVEGYEISKGTKIVIHHMNAITVADVKNWNPIILDPEFLITTIIKTHSAIHYGTESYEDRTLTERFSNDTIPWR